MHPTSLLQERRARLCARVIGPPLPAAVTVLATAVTAQGMPFTGSSGFGSALVGSAPVGTGRPSWRSTRPPTPSTSRTATTPRPERRWDTVSVIDARHCNAQDVSTCKGPWPTITVGNLPNGATCNGTNHSGCGRTPATASAGFGSVSVALDPATGTVYVANIEDTSVTVINGATCNGTDTTGCGQAHPKAAVGNYPGATTIDPASGTAYISNSDNTLSVIHG